MSEAEDYTAIFFQECDELLDDLEGHLAAIAAGTGDAELVNAAFRAVHSIKGGADAFGYRDLVGFAHVLEATMDAIRGGRLAGSPELGEVLIRGRDVLCDLVEAARSGSAAPMSAVEAMAGELAALGGGATGAGRAARAGAPGAAPAAARADDPPPGPERRCRIRFVPGRDFQRSGHDALRLIQALRALGTLQVRVRGDIPPLDAFDPEVCPLAWDLTLATGRDPRQIERFFDIYRAAAEIVIDDTEAAAATAAPAPAPAAPAPAAADDVVDPSAVRRPRMLRVDLDRVDRLVNMVGEIVIAQAAMAQTLADSGGGPALGHAIDAMARQIRALQESAMAIRAQPMKGVLARVARLVRDLAQQLGKEVRTEISGEHTEVDSTVIDELAEPLIHIVRNAMDHGIETPDQREKAGKPRQGTVQICARRRGERVVISIADDGRGIDRARVLDKAAERGLIAPGMPMTPEEIDHLIFYPGLTTTATVSNVSGRGVGMDVVRRNISALGGRVALESRPGAGTRITVTLPLSLAVLDGMTIAVGDQRFVIPLSAVVKTLTLADARPQSLSGGGRVMAWRDDFLPLLSLRASLGVAGPRDSEQLVIVVDGDAADADTRIGLLVDELVEQCQVVLKSLEANYRRVPGVSGATILSDGSPALILDVAALRGLTTSAAAAGGMEHVQ